MAIRSQTVFAPITGLPPAAVSVIRISGPEAWSVAAQVFKPWTSDPKPREALYGQFSHGDDGLALPFEEGHSFTGEQTVEFSIHGSRASLAGLLAACQRAGARPAEPGEFTLRAFLNGRIDLTQAEAIRDTVEAETERQLVAANRNRGGLLRHDVTRLVRELMAILAALEASVDFSEEIGEFDRLAAHERILSVVAELGRLKSQSGTSRLVREGLRVAIVGPPNAGKSSLLNRLLGMERSIVTAIPGTTRDTVEEKASFMGYPVVLVDTAGIRESADLIETIGIQRSLVAAASADIVWYVFDATVGLTDSDRAQIALFSRPVRLLANKSDLTSSDVGSPISALTGTGIESLVVETVERFEFSDGVAFVNDRQSLLLAQTHDVLVDALAHLAGETPSDLLSVLLSEAIHHLGEITGQTVGADMLERIFQDFCIGK